MGNLWDSLKEACVLFQFLYGMKINWIYFTKLNRPCLESDVSWLRITGLLFLFIFPKPVLVQISFKWSGICWTEASAPRSSSTVGILVLCSGKSEWTIHVSSLLPWWRRRTPVTYAWSGEQKFWDVSQHGFSRMFLCWSVGLRRF